jgi:hypothetical protein
MDVGWDSRRSHGVVIWLERLAKLVGSDAEPVPQLSLEPFPLGTV